MHKLQLEFPHINYISPTLLQFNKAYSAVKRIRGQIFSARIQVITWISVSLYKRIHHIHQRPPHSGTSGNRIYCQGCQLGLDLLTLKKHRAFSRPALHPFRPDAWFGDEATGQVYPPPEWHRSDCPLLEQVGIQNRTD